MLKKLSIFTFILVISSTNVFANKVKIIDDNNISSVKEINYETKEELNTKLKELLESLQKDGYIYSNFRFENSNLYITNKKISKVEYIDSNMKLNDFKKYINGLDIEGEVLNINKINEIIKNFNENEANKLHVDIFENDDDSVTVKFTNEYKGKNTLQFNSISNVYKDKSFYYNLSFNANQNLGLNENFNISFTALKDKLNINAKYDMDIRKVNLSLSDKYTYTKKGKAKTYENNLALKMKYKILENSISYSFKKQNIEDKNTTNLKYIDLITALNISKNNFTFRPEAKVVLGFDNDKYSKTIGILSLDASYTSKYYNLNLEMAKLLNGSYNDIFKKYRFSNDMSYLAYPIKMDENTAYVLVNNKFKLPNRYKELSYAPFAEIALGYSKEDKFNIGASLGIEAMYKNLTFGIKYSMDVKNNKNISIMVNYKIF